MIIDSKRWHNALKEQAEIDTPPEGFHSAQEIRKAMPTKTPQEIRSLLALMDERGTVEKSERKYRNHDNKFVWFYKIID